MAVSESRISAAMNYVASLAIAEIAEREQISSTEAAECFLTSRTAEQLFDDSLKLWWDGPSAIADLYYEETRAHDA